MLNLAHFKDDSSPNGAHSSWNTNTFFEIFCCDSMTDVNFYAAWDYSAWVRTYALFLEERMECFRILKYDVETDRPVTHHLYMYQSIFMISLSIY